MSANNQVLIRFNPEGLYRIDDIDADTGAANLHVANNIESLEEAVEKANQYLDKCEEEGYPVEYGLDIQTRVSATPNESLT